MERHGGCCRIGVALALGAAAWLTGTAAGVAGCAEESSPGEPGSGGCRTDADCPDGTACGDDGLCRELGAGGGSGTDACGASDDCWRTEPGTVPDVYWDGGDAGDPVCTIPLRSCPGADACAVPTACLQPPEGADRPGAFACERDDQCLSGRCLGLGSTGICARACATDADCPFFQGDTLAASGFRCKEVNDRGIVVQACLPADDALPEATLCRTACDCVAGGDCAAAGTPGALACRFEGRRRFVKAVPLCEPPAEGGGVPTLAPCPEEPSACAGGACNVQCDANTVVGSTHFCTELLRCTEPCGKDTDCPPRTVCTTGQDDQRVGSWLLSFQREFFAGREIRFCIPPSPACFDEVDCCPEPDGVGGCLRGWTADRGRCSVELGPQLSAPRLLTVCRAPDGRSEPGACCGSHADCDSSLCVPARPGTGCAGGGVCSVPCEPFPDPDGVPGSGDERERCALGNFSSSYHLQSRCLPFDYELTASDGSSRMERLDACQ